MRYVSIFDTGNGFEVLLEGRLVEKTHTRRQAKLFKIVYAAAPRFFIPKKKGWNK